MKQFIQNSSINLSFLIFSANSKFEGFRGWFDHWDRNQLLKFSFFIFSQKPLGRISLLKHKLKSNSWKISIWFSKDLPFLLGPNSLCKRRETFLRFLLRLFLGFRPQSQASALRLALKPKKSLWERLWRTFCEALPQALPETLLESLAPNLGFCL